MKLRSYFEVFRHGTGRGTMSHPTVSKHIMRAELFTWIHAMVLLDAIYTVHSDLLNHGSANKLLQGGSVFKIFL